MLRKCTKKGTAQLPLNPSLNTHEEFDNFEALTLQVKQKQDNIAL